MENREPQQPNSLKISAQAPLGNLQEWQNRFTSSLQLAHDGFHDESLTELHAVLAAHPSFPKAGILQASLLFSLSRWEEAQRICLDLLQQDSYCIEAYLILGSLGRQFGKDEEALKRFREAIYVDSQSWLAHFTTAEILFAQGDTKRSLIAYDSALRILKQQDGKSISRWLFPLQVNAESFLRICNYKLSILNQHKISGKGVIAHGI